LFKTLITKRKVQKWLYHRNWYKTICILISKQKESNTSQIMASLNVQSMKVRHRKCQFTYRLDPKAFLCQLIINTEFHIASSFNTLITKKERRLLEFRDTVNGIYNGQTGMCKNCII
jgi:hypothetical protein